MVDAKTIITTRNNCGWPTCSRSVLTAGRKENKMSKITYSLLIAIFVGIGIGGVVNYADSNISTEEYVVDSNLVWITSSYDTCEYTFDANSDPLILGKIFIHWMKSNPENFEELTLSVPLKDKAEYDAIMEGEELVIEIDTPTFDDLLDAIEWVESKGDANAVGDKKFIKYTFDGHKIYEYQAIGAYQIHKIYVDDCNRIAAGRSAWACENRYRYEDRWSKEKSREMTWLYIDYYSKQVINSTPELLAYCPEIKWFEIMARIHNGGPDGWRNDPQWFVRNRDYTLEEAKKKIANTKAYWLKVKERLYD